MRATIPRWARRRVRGAIDSLSGPDELNVVALAHRTGLSAGLVRACLTLELRDDGHVDEVRLARLREARTER